MKGIVVLSGGMDSTVALYLAKNSSRLSEVEAVSFNYGSKHNDEEFKRAQASCSKLDVKLTRIDLPFIDEHFNSSLLKSGGEIPEGHYEDSTMKSTVVPFRNGIMLSIAAGFAESKGAKMLILGNHFGDHAVYPDCRKSFIDPMKAAIECGTYAEIELYSPFCDIDKTEVCKIGASLGVDYKMTYSCYKGGEVHCGRCSTCVERIEAFREAEITDPTKYFDHDFAVNILDSRKY